MAPLSSFPVSGRSPDVMQTLAFNLTEKILYDYSRNENFYSLSNNILYAVSPSYVFNWFCTNASTATVIYNPFQGNLANPPTPSTLVQNA